MRAESALKPKQPMYAWKEVSELGQTLILSCHLVPLKRAWCQLLDSCLLIRIGSIPSQPQLSWSMWS